MTHIIGREVFKLSDGATLNIQIDDKALQDKLNSLVDAKTMLEVHNKFAQFCNEYVPMDEGVLSQTVQITPEFVRYYAPYAHYMYVGEIYGPNIPSISKKTGEIIGWFSPPGKEKQPTGRPLKYSQEKHPKASKEWDKAMMAERGQEFIQAVKKILIERARELYG